MSLRNVGRNSRVNRDRRDQSFARSVIAEATRRYNEQQQQVRYCQKCKREVHPHLRCVC